MLALLEAIPGFRVYAGTERYLLDVIDAGGAGCISATTNVTCGLAAEVLRARPSDGARLLQEHLTEIRAVFERYPFVPALKRYLSDRMGIPSWRHLRPPLSALSDVEFAELAAALRKAGFPPG